MRGCRLVLCGFRLFFGHFRLIGLAIETDEQEEVAGKQEGSKRGSNLFSSAVIVIRHEGPECRGEVVVRAKVDDKQVNNELSNLQGSKILLPPNAVSSSSASVIVIHQDVNHEVKDNRHPRHTGSAIQLSETQHHGHAMMVPMQKSDILSLHSQEHGVDQFPVLDEVIEVIQMFQFLSPSVVVTDGVKESMSGNNGNQLLYEQQQQTTRDSSKKHVMEDEQPLQAESRNIQALEQELSGENQEIVSKAGP